MMTPAERLILENQKLIMHALRIILHKVGAPDHQFLTMQDGMQRIDHFLDAFAPKEPHHG